MEDERVSGYLLIVGKHNDKENEDRKRQPKHLLYIERGPAVIKRKRACAVEIYYAEN